MKTIIITGASAGIGRATALHFLDQGWRVGLIARRPEVLAEMAHPNAVPLPCDVTDEAGVDAAFAAFGHLDVLFNNAGMFGPQTTIDEIALEDWRAVLDVNLTGMFLCARAAFRQMRHQTPRGGRIINNGSISAHTPREGSICYTTTKHGVSGLTKTLTLDGRAFDIACGQIDIGNARTELVQGLEVKRAADGLPPLPTMAVEDVARAVFHMASLPPEANVQTMMVMASKMPHIGRG
ncbi:MULTISPECIES: SDR family oxidoreductase [Yoonia]|jgi:NAD(P)-dependent dehydrogenase (short-subunit alcohol dehydrogenase family)|uniref:Oxidoreductase, short chain dehydrogenase/reductase family n=1 Tax=Yoonia vestfoldensis SKA53 TaxID=314232 RepID=A3V577_9RHOB|nr:SDR family oxidoreductase [Yoonia vestfoldensis]EAQ06795.1 oxidoreductase, short chain dehydrogenase/reductase family [Yoonia vestfoldensis SKA53]